MPYSPKEFTCENCGKAYLIKDPRPSRLPKKFLCSQRCRREDRLLGKKFNRLTVVGISDISGFAKVVCECGTEKEVDICAITQGHTRSCGCLKMELISARSMKTVKQKVWDKVRKIDSGCWEFTGSLAKSGYGTTTHRQKSVRVHRLAWEDVNGPIPDGLHVLHRCDNTKCCNPAHLFLGTHQDNMEDCRKKGRARSGWHSFSDEQKQKAIDRIKKAGKSLIGDKEFSEKIRKTRIGTKKKVLSDGSWTWAKPEQAI